MKDKIIDVIGIYKIIINFLRIIPGFLIFYFKGNIYGLIHFLFRKELLEDSNDFLFDIFLSHLLSQSTKLSYLLAVTLIAFSSFEIFFSVGLLFRKRSSAIGLFVVSILWIPVELLFISKFLIIHEVFTIILEMIVIVILFNIIYKHKRSNKTLK